MVDGRGRLLKPCGLFLGCVQAVAWVPAPLEGNARELHNDDLILQTCDYYRSHLVQVGGT